MTESWRRRKKQCLLGNTLVGNGAETVTITTRHGRFSLRRLRLRDGHGQEVHLPCPRLSEPLRRQALFWVNRLSFGDVARLLTEMTGAAALSEDGLWRLAQREAQALDDRQRQDVLDAAALPEPEYTARPCRSRSTPRGPAGAGVHRPSRHL